MKLILLLFAVIMMLCGCSQESKEPSLPSHIKKLIAKGDPINLHEAGVAYETGDGVPIDLVEAVKWYYQAAKKGNVHSHYAIWELWENFGGWNLDPPFPMEQFKKPGKAAIVGYEKMLENHKDPELYYRLGLLYDPGIGIGGVEEEISEKYLRMAADMGHEEAKELLIFIEEWDQDSR